MSYTKTSLIRFFGQVILCWIIATQASLAEDKFTHIKDVIICYSDAASMPDFEDARCTKTSFYDIKPHKKSAWVKATVTVADEVLKQPEPLGLFISGTISSSLYWNGSLLGHNGKPASNAMNEIPGKMDAVFSLPRQQIRAGKNSLVIHLSNHHSYIALKSPIHYLAIGPYNHPPNVALKNYLSSAIPLGILLVGMFYFGFQGIRQENILEGLALPLGALFTVLQLFAEITRGLFQYEYPFQEIRLILVALFSGLTGSFLFYYIFQKFCPNIRSAYFFAGLLMLQLPAFIEPSFNDKAAFAMLGPTIGAFLLTSHGIYKQKPHAKIYTVVLFLFAVIIIAAPNAFLDTYYYYSVALLFIFLFWDHATLLEEKRALLLSEQKRADKLQLVLESKQENDNPSIIQISEAGKIKRINTKQIIYCQAAGDYVEIHLKGGMTLLHTARLSRFEQTLPSSFMRVHRSYLVNTHHILELVRETSGQGTLKLTEAQTIPVSRRIMPQVRKALS
ncbi:LytTR family DNA-binding domain-containing protein [Kordiimonas laminariae]|uniref:LytTR family DNA-binding domain-containing protein n=1 Tax=Kordiimonas laminariae TaxID=2917717 RepID=UPI001FF4931A|nr:LytTR family DNA-binding domain-containing protein [Kordiimonas laminariae]MCK0070306.1 LytTR family transcriptional regulator [Kordiimonas laminariae]